MTVSANVTSCSHPWKQCCLQVAWVDFFLSFVAPSVPAPPEQCIPDFSPLLLPCKCYAVESQSLAHAFGVDTPSSSPRSNLLCHPVSPHSLLHGSVHPSDFSSKSLLSPNLPTASPRVCHQQSPSEALSGHFLHCLS